MDCSILIRHGVVAVLLAVTVTQAWAGVVVTGTRLIYPGGDRELTVLLNNQGESPALVQVWIDSGDIKSTPTNAAAPFVISPPIFRMDSKSTQSLRVMFTSEKLPKDQESVFWFNMLDVPSRAEGSIDSNMLQMAFRTRIKLFYRPQSLIGNSAEAIEKLQWKVVQRGKDYVLQAHNPSAFHVTVSAVALLIDTQRISSGGGMIGPGIVHDFPISELKRTPDRQATVEFEAVNDYGADVTVKQSLIF